MRTKRRADNGCQKIVPISGRFFATTAYAAILFSKRNYAKRYKLPALPGHPEMNDKRVASRN
jgi:hypothetical protein